MPFPNELNHFSMIVDIVPDDIFSGVWTQVWKYAHQEYGAHLIELLVPTPIGAESKDGLEDTNKKWPHTKDTDSYRRWNRELKTDGKYNGYVSYVFATKKQVWVTWSSSSETNAEDGCPTGPEKLDHWDSSEGVEFVSVAEGARTRTEITVPLNVGANELPIGVLNIETDREIAPRTGQKEDIKTIARAIARLQRLNEAYNMQHKGTTDRLGEIKGSDVDSRRDRIFIAYAAAAPDDVVQSVLATLEQLGLCDFVYDWKEDNEPGDIRGKLWSEIGKTRQFIGYLSEPAGGGDTHGFRDNPNVLFELGMGISAKLEHPGNVEEPIIIREKDSPKMAFDYSGYRVIEVGRDDDGEILAESTDKLNNLRNFLATVGEHNKRR